ncbi:MAG: bifunctional glutamate N-acetyltransferase/amino-acid acetyltransferase ArgJ [Candidatus Aenigmarchaeota archaeon]|nr:bifunctional glutamate N-acetyltransferase/amino-acid acetyltransferase ArgJ [Candidatus Aenigmarchaeota archaeon]
MVPQGFHFSTAEAAIKKPGRKDLALIYSEVEANIAGMFTTNKVKAAPVRLDMKRIKGGRGQAIVVNSGNANACTGKKGMEDAAEMANLVAHGLKIKPSLVFVCSTGVIGTPMPMDRIRPNISELIKNLGKAVIEDVAGAIMTTDTFPKIVRKKVKIKGKTGSIVGICKGAGMICPRMATMLCFIMTDIAVHRKALDKVLDESVKRSFNRITVDGDMSTNDTVLIMANGMLGNEEITEKSESYAAFRNALSGVTYELSKLIAMDGEGATKFIEIEVKGARNEADAEKAAFAVGNSNLVKTAMYGNDANWGRIMAALGYSGIDIKEEKVDIYFSKVKMVSKGMTTGKDKEAGDVLRQKQVKIIINLHAGKASAKVLTCDMTEQYVRVNADYRT